MDMCEVAPAVNPLFVSSCEPASVCTELQPMPCLKPHKNIFTEACAFQARCSTHRRSGKKPVPACGISEICSLPARQATASAPVSPCTSGASLTSTADPTEALEGRCWRARELAGRALVARGAFARRVAGSTKCAAPPTHSNSALYSDLGSSGMRRVWTAAVDRLDKSNPAAHCACLEQQASVRRDAAAASLLVLHIKACSRLAALCDFVMGPLRERM